MNKLRFDMVLSCWRHPKLVMPLMHETTSALHTRLEAFFEGGDSELLLFRNVEEALHESHDG